MPVPVDYPASANTDQSGNASVSGPVRAAYWCLIWATCGASGAPDWTLTVNGTPRLFGADASAVMGPVMVPPGSSVGVNCIGASPNTQLSIDFWGWQSDGATNGEDLAPMAGGAITQQGLTNVNVMGPVPVSDGGLAGSITEQLSVMNLYQIFPLNSGATTTFSVGAGTANPYPDQVGAWMLQVVGIGQAGGGARVLWSGLTVGGATIYTRQRDSSTIIYGSLVLTGDVDAPAISWNITLSSSAPAGCLARLYFAASELPDQYFDSAIYGPTFTTGGGILGMDGYLLSVQNVGVNAGGSSLNYTLASYRGPVQIGCQVTQAAYLAISEYDYTGATLRLGNNFLVSPSGPGYLLTVAYLGGLNQHITCWNTSASNLQLYLNVRAIQDLI